ncbi:MAG: hypothetical protein A2V98_20670 [Planctomycetes bacterium RBG_16_64_12]|nr:MAG: hypothetical protein A2V98_20670 [Planctomycetes bacterium RBG_16_64_12]
MRTDRTLNSQPSTPDRQPATIDLDWRRRRRPPGEKLYESDCGRYRVRRRSIVCGVKVPSPPWYPLVFVDLPDGRQMWDLVDRIRHRTCAAAMAACQRHAKLQEASP